jgi:hypothetical protein
MLRRTAIGATVGYARLGTNGCGVLFDSEMRTRSARNIIDL